MRRNGLESNDENELKSGMEVPGRELMIVEAISAGSAALERERFRIGDFIRLAELRARLADDQAWAIKACWVDE